MASAGITFGMAKESLAEVVDNGVCADDPRVMRRTNSAIKLLLDLGTWVNTMATYDVVASGTELLLPKQLENAIEVEVQTGLVLNQSDVVQGHYDLVNPLTYVDPSSAHDNPLDDLFLHPDPVEVGVLRRKYNYPGLTPNSVVRVTGKKRYLPIDSDEDSLIIQNVEAIRSAILYLEFKNRGAGSIDDAAKYLADAKGILESEVKQHQLDPRKSLKRKANYQSDLITYTEGTLGQTRARLALELSGFLLRGKSEITYLVNRAQQMLIDNRNQLYISGRIGIHGDSSELTYTALNEPEKMLVWPDYNQIRLMVQSFITESGDPQAVTVAEEYQKRAFDLQRAMLIETTEKKRHTIYTEALDTYVSGTFGWTCARMALELKGGLALSEAEIERLVSVAEMRIMERGKYKGTLRTLSATIAGGDILFPRDVEGVVAADICGYPADINSIFHEYIKNGPGHCCACEAYFLDQGEVYFPQSGGKRRKYFYKGSKCESVQFDCVVKLRWVQKEACDEMVIKNFEALRTFSQGILLEREEKWTEAGAAKQEAIGILDRELAEHLSGVIHRQNADSRAGYGFSGLGGGL